MHDRLIFIDKKFQYSYSMAKELVNSIFLIKRNTIMSGHSKWATIKHKKAKEDNKRGKVFTKLSREITVAAKEGGGDPAGNARLRMVLEKAKAANMPHDNVSRAIKKGTGEGGGAHYEFHLYEGYGPCGIAVMVETLSDNKNRTVADLRHLFGKLGGNLAEGGAVAWMFNHRGVLRVATKKSEDDLLELLIEYDIDDISSHDGVVTVICKLQDLDLVKKALEHNGFIVEDAAAEWVPQNHIVPASKEQEESIYKFLEQLDDLDDVQNVYANVGG